MPAPGPAPVPGPQDDAPAAALSGAARSLDVEVRHLRGREEFVACVELQHEIWGATFNERVPAAILHVSQRIGGITAGAFTPDGRIVGFVFGLTGLQDGTPVHWSDMLAVRAALRDHGIGRRLKEFQRDALLQLGVDRMYWTFDPLVARNAHFNFNRLGVHAVEYVVDMYGAETSSALHRAIGTDRFIVAWDLRDEGRATRPRVPHPGQAIPLAGADGPVLNRVDDRGRPTPPDLPRMDGVPICRVAVPLAIDAMQAQRAAALGPWRATTRAALSWALHRGYQVRGFIRDAAAGNGYYVLSTTPPG